MKKTDWSIVTIISSKNDLNFRIVVKLSVHEGVEGVPAQLGNVPPDGPEVGEGERSSDETVQFDGVLL